MKLLFENWRKYLLKEGRPKQNLGPWIKEYKNLKKVFIKREILSRRKQIENIIHDKLVSKYRGHMPLSHLRISKNIIRDLVRQVRRVPIRFVDDNPCVNHLGEHGPGCYINGTVIVSQFSSYWLSDYKEYGNTITDTFKNMIFHELAHAKEAAIDSTFFPGMLRLGAGGHYSAAIESRIKKCFPGLKRRAQHHHELSSEHYASLGQLRTQLGRPFNRTDIELVCAWKKLGGKYERGPALEAYDQASANWQTMARKLGPAGMVPGEVVVNEIWNTFSCQKCGPGGDFGFAIELMNDLIARFEAPQKILKIKV